MKTDSGTLSCVKGREVKEKAGGDENKRTRVDLKENLVGHHTAGFRALRFSTAAKKL